MAATDEQKLFARVFRGEDGDKALAYLRGLTLDAPLMGADGKTTEMLWHLEGRRSLAKQIINLVEQGRKG
jgi:hypothetical protein